MNFHLYGIYKKFSKIYDYDQYAGSICNSYMEGNYESISDILSVCRKIDRIFASNIFNVSSHKLTRVNKYCEYISYFLYEKIKKISSNSNFLELYNALNNAKTLYRFNSDNCSIINFSGKNGKFDKMKELYFRNEILQEIKDKYHRNFIDEEEFCKKYIRESADLYNEIVKDNFCKYDEYYKNILTNFLNNFEETKNILERNSIKKLEVDTQLSPIPSCVSEQRGATSEQVRISDAHSQGQGVSKHGGLSTDMAPSSTPDTGKNNIGGVVSGIFIGTFSLFLIIYKFTPLGSSLHNKIWKTKKKFNLEDKSDELILDASDENMDLYNSMYNIQYHSSQNA
ncbi:PIR protein [Plasmodium ovale]|uniref:PIR protein n=1 Tax=Plasmodium ovale TaxID=36330 RepID=A0A1D3JDK9_PLAOA|nr:PIR protein [Plasmodium ovale]